MIGNPDIRRDGSEIRLQWPGLVVLAYERPDGIEIGQFASAGRDVRADVEARVRKILLTE
jgi:hypothetical protein